MQLSEYGVVVEKCWQWLSTQYSYVDLDEYIVMPNHLHGILIIKDDSFRRGGSRTAPKDGSLTQRGDSRIAPTMDDHKKPKSLGRLIGAFKTLSTKSINEMRGTPGEASWQRNFYEHIIRDEEDLHHIREYIANNPVQWMLDENNPDNINNDMYGRFANRP